VAENNKKSWRRLTIGAVWFISFVGGFFYLSAQGHKLDVLQLYAVGLTTGCLFFGGYITATDILERVKK